MNTKKLLKSIKLNESAISVVLGIFVVVIVGVLTYKYFTTKKVGVVSEGVQTEEKATAGKTYTVKKGQTLWKISEEAYNSGYNWVDIAKENNIENPDSITEGQVLNLPTLSAKEEVVANTENSKEDETKTVEANTYEVKHGDTLWKIAVEAYGDGYKWVDIAKANNLTNPNVIHSGNILTLPR